MDDIMERHEFAMEFLNRLHIGFDHAQYTIDGIGLWHDDIAEFLGKEVNVIFKEAINKVRSEWMKAGIGSSYLPLRKSVWEEMELDQRDYQRFIVLFDKAYQEVIPMMSRESLFKYIQEGLNE